MVNSGTYAGISTTKGTYGGSDASDPAYNFWSASGVNVLYNAMTWAADSDEIVSKAIVSVMFGNEVTQEDMLDLFVLRQTSYLAFLKLLRTKERFFADSTKLKALGFGANRNIALSYDGVDVTWSAGVPATDSDEKTVHGYGWNFDYIELCWLGGQLFDSMSVYDEKQHAQLFSLIGGGNMKFKSPRHQVKLAEWPT